MSPAKRRLSGPASQDASDVIALTRAARRLCGHWTVDDVARLIEFSFKKEFLFIYLLIYY